MTGSAPRGTDANKCDNCESVLDLMRKMNDKMDQMTDRFNGVETLLKSENEKLRKQLENADKKYELVCGKVDEMAAQINRLKQENISRNVMIKGVPEIETDVAHLKSMVSLIFGKLRYQFPLTYVDCFRIGRKKDDTCRPIVVILPNVGLKNLIIKDKRSTKISCANFSNDGNLWGRSDQLIYIDEHLTRENHLLFMSARKLKTLGFKYVWTRNGRVFVRFNEGSKVISVDSIADVTKLAIRAKLDAKAKDDEEIEVIPTQADTERETEDDGELDEDLEKYEQFIENSPKKRSKRKKDSPQGHAHGTGPPKSRPRKK